MKSNVFAYLAVYTKLADVATADMATVRDWSVASMMSRDGYDRTTRSPVSLSAPWSLSSVDFRHASERDGPGARNDVAPTPTRKRRVDRDDR